MTSTSLTKEEYMKIINQNKKKIFTLNETTLNHKLHDIKLQDEHNKLKQQEIDILQSKIKEYDIKLEEQQNREKEYQVKESELNIKIKEFDSTQSKIQQENANKEHVLKRRENETKERYTKLKEYETHLKQIKIQQEEEHESKQNQIKQDHATKMNHYRMKEQEYETKTEQLKTKEQYLDAIQNKIQQEHQKNTMQLKTTEHHLNALQKKIQQEHQENTSQIKVKEEEMNEHQKKMQQEYQSKIIELKTKEQQLNEKQKKRDQEHQANLIQVKIKEQEFNVYQKKRHQEYQANVSQLKVNEEEFNTRQKKMQEENQTKTNELKTKEHMLIALHNKMNQEHQTAITQLKQKEEEYETKMNELKRKEEERIIKENIDFLPHITIVKIPCMMYIIHIIQDELIKMGWNCSIIDKTEINNYIYVNNPKHYFLFLLANQIHANVIDYKRYILYQLEQNVNNELSINYKYLHDTGQLQSIYDNATLLFDYSEININITKKYYSNEFKWMNVPAIHVNHDQDHDDYEYDIIFIGQLNKRRKYILDKLKEKYKVLVVNNIYGEELKKLCNKSNICLNIHYYKNAILERVRLNEMMEYGMKIISEKPCDEDMCVYYESVHFINVIEQSMDKSMDESMDELCSLIEQIKYENKHENHSNDLKKLHSIFVEDVKVFKNICILPKQIAIITANYGNYDTIKEVNVDHKHYFDWFLFTNMNDDIKSETYNVVQYPLKFDYAHNNDFNRLYAKYIKCQALNIDILKKYEYIIWTDSSLQIKNKHLIRDILNLLNKNDSNNSTNSDLDSTSDLYFYEHSRRNNIMDEYTFSKPLSKYHNHKMEEQINKYRTELYHDNLYECGIFILKNNEKNIKIMNDWWEENVTYSYQDQLSLPYVLWKNNAKPFSLNEKETNDSRDSNDSNKLNKIKGSVLNNKLFGTIQQHRK